MLLLHMPRRPLQSILELSNYTLLGKGFKLCPLGQTRHWEVLQLTSIGWRLPSQWCWCVHRRPAEKKKGFALTLKPGAGRRTCLQPRAVPKQLAGGWPRGLACRHRAGAPGNYNPWDYVSCVIAADHKMNSIDYQATVLFLFSFMLLKWLSDVLAITALAESSRDCKCSAQSWLKISFV